VCICLCGVECCPGHGTCHKLQPKQKPICGHKTNYTRVPVPMTVSRSFPLRYYVCHVWRHGLADSTRSRVAYQAALSAPAMATVQQQHPQQQQPQQQQQQSKSKSGGKNFVSVLWRLELFATCFHLLLPPRRPLCCMCLYVCLYKYACMWQLHILSLHCCCFHIQGTILCKCIST